MRHLHRVIALVLAMSLASGKAHSQAAAGPDFQVVIIAVTEFSDPLLRDSQLSAGIKEATEELKSFFEKKIHTSPVVFTTAEQTSADSIRNWLFQDLQKNSSPAVHLIFVLTHGFAYASTEPDSNKGELFLATSDTCKVRSDACKKSLIGSTIRGGEFIDAFRDMPKRATVFFFIDSCGSGAIDSENLQKTLTHQPEFASRLMIFASAMPDESAYSARFTKALTNIWQASQPATHCGRRQIERFLTSSLRVIAGVSSDSPQTVRLIAPLMPDFCIESFNYNNRLLFLSNAAPGTVTVTLQPEDREPEEPIILDQNENMPIGDLRPISYTLVAKRNDGQDPPIVRTVDLTSTPAHVEVLFSSDPIDKISAAQSAVIYLDSRGILPSVAAEFRRNIQVDVARQFSALAVLAEGIAREEYESDSSQAALSLEMPKRRASLYELQRHSEQAAQRAKECGALGVSCVTARRDWEAAEAEFEKMQAQSADMEWQAERERQRSAQLRGRKRVLEYQRTRLDTITKAFEDLDGAGAAAAQVEASLKKDLQTIFRDVSLSDRGIVVTLPYGVVRTVNHSPQLKELVNILNRFPSVHIEIEFAQPGRNSLLEQSAVRHRALALRNELRNLGLKSSFVVARGFVFIGGKKPTASIILSP